MLWLCVHRVIDDTEKLGEHSRLALRALVIPSKRINEVVITALFLMASVVDIHGTRKVAVPSPPSAPPPQKKKRKHVSPSATLLEEARGMSLGAIIRIFFFIREIGNISFTIFLRIFFGILEKTNFKQYFSLFSKNLFFKNCVCNC